MTENIAGHMDTALSASVAGRINVAFHQNSVPAIAEIGLINETDDDLSDLSVSVSTVPDFLQPKVFRLDYLRARGVARINPVAVDLNASFLLALTEAVLGEISIVAKVGEAEISRLTTPCQLLSPSEWTGLATAPELVAAFVRPNDRSIDVILRNAAEKLRQAGRDASLDGYRSRKKLRAWEVAEAIWAALCDERIVYALPPQSFEQNGQKVRWPTAVVESKIGTCLDLALLFAACLEQAGLNPLVGFSEGHAFVGLWLIDEDFALGVVDEPQTLRKRIRLEELVLIETTLLTNQPPARFRAAVEKAETYVDENAERRFELVVDLRRARRRQIKPLALGTEIWAPSIGVSAAPGIAATLEAPRTFADEEVVTEESDETLDRLERWKRKLLDLSLRNRLLNFKITKGAVPFVCPDPAALEDLLTQGKRIKLLPAAEVMSGVDPRSSELHFRTVGDDAPTRYAAEALQRGEVHANLNAEELEGRLTEIYRTARSSFEEGGSNSLFLAFGFISWSPQNKIQACKAPLLLMPVALERRTVRSGFRLMRHDDDPRINPTLLQMLRQDFKLAIPEFERDLPVDEAGLDVARIWRIARTHLKEVKGFEVTEEVVLSNFSFAKYLMWKDLVDRTDLLKRNRVVRHLIDTPKESYGDGGGLPDERRLDYDVHPRELFLPLPADSSQTAAVVAASRNKDFVLEGPPGTGKSQTIANMIVQLLAYGRTVLFVSAKTTALEVVRRRLNDVGLGSFCLEVHSAKAQKSVVLNQLKSAWEARAATAAQEWDGTTSDLKALRDRLNRVVAALHRRHGNGLTAHQAMGRVVAGRDFLPGFELPFAAPDQHDATDMRRFSEICRSLKTALDSIGVPSHHPLARIGRKNWSPVWQGELIAAAKKFEASAAELAESSAAVAALFGAPANGNPRYSRDLLALAAQAMTSESQKAKVLLTPEGARMRESFDAWRPIQARYLEIASGLACSYRDGIFKLDLIALLNEWREASNANIFVRGGRKKRVRQALAPFAEGSLPDDVSADIVRLIDLNELRETAQRYDTVLSGLGHAWDGLATDAAEIDALFAWAIATAAAAARLARPELTETYWLEALLSLISRFTSEPKSSALGSTVAQLVDAYKSFDTDRENLVTLAELTDEWLGTPLGDDWLAKTERTVRAWEEHATQSQRWCAWRQIAESAKAQGIGALVSALMAGSIASDQIEYTFDLGYARWWIQQVVEQEEPLRTFVAEQHNDAIARFVELDEKVAELARHVVAAQLCGNIPPPTGFGSDPEFGTLSRELQKRSRHMPLRQLFGQMPTALTRLAPCIMMSPLSVAQFLPAEARSFDVVVFDEASQIPVWDAIGAIARGTQVIVVGDPKQLPPTTFFDRAGDDYDDSSDLEDLESILDECLAANIPHKRLAWHYRSRHESLIAFSNERYYEGRLVTFPSPMTADRAVHYEHVPGGVYERGSGRVNRGEARAVVRDVVRRLSAPTSAEAPASIGIVTFNTEQQHLIETMLDQERRAHPELEPFFNSTGHEPVFVKNLESVQGDERDVILFSVGYGPDASGRVSQNFGPLNKDGGTRRLNVAITRARTELVVFATLRAEQIDLSRTKAAGARDFKHFLEYAERGSRALAEAAAPLHRGPESPLEEAVQHALEERGWTVHPQVGVAGFRVDFGVVDPDAPGRYLAGIECDGATYHRSATARDRDLLREQVLRNLGWRIHRVWSTDWWVDAERAVASLVTALEGDLEADRQSASAEEAPIEPAAETEPAIPLMSDDAEIIIEPQEADDATAKSEPEIASGPVRRYGERNGIVTSQGQSQQELYRAADLSAAGFDPDRHAFYDIAYRPTLCRMAAHVITVEGPIFDDLLVQRIARAHGFGRAAGRIRDAVLRVVERRFPTSDEAGRRIYWPEGADSKRLPCFRISLADNRGHSDIPLVELSALASQFLDAGAEVEEVPALMARKLGLSRLREATHSRFLQAAELATKNRVP